MSYDLAHTRLNHRFPKSGICERCGKKRRTEYSFKWHPLPATENREDYYELCVRCHVEYHQWLRKPPESKAVEEWLGSPEKLAAHKLRASVKPRQRKRRLKPISQLSEEALKFWEGR